MDSNIVESWNAILKEAREYPLICMFEYTRTTVMSWFSMRRMKSTRQQGRLSPHVQKLVEKTFEEYTSMAVRPIIDLQFQVQERSGECFTVLLGESTYSCMEFQSLRIP